MFGRLPGDTYKVTYTERSVDPGTLGGALVTEWDKFVLQSP